MYKTKEKFRWYGKDDIIPEHELPSKDVIKVWIERGHIEEVKGEDKPAPKKNDTNSDNPLDFNDDGKVDAEDYSLAGKALAHSRKSSSKKKSTKKKSTKKKR